LFYLTSLNEGRSYPERIKESFRWEEVLREIVNKETAVALWLKLETLYMTKSLANKLRLKEMLYIFRMVEGTAIQTHLDDFNSIIMDLHNIDINIED
ncbi:hypothetical protein Lal_00038554, partial [Lupinus albus]